MNKITQIIKGKINLSLICLMLVSSIGFVGCDDDDDDDAPIAPQSTQTVSDRDFVVRAGHVNRAEVELGQLAQTKGGSDTVRNYGTLMVTEHTKAQNDLITLAANKNITLPTALDSANLALKTQLMAASGAQFDSLYMKNMVTSHQMSVNLFQNEINQGQDPDIKNYASIYLPHIQMHLSMADSIVKKRPLPVVTHQ